MAGFMLRKFFIFFFLLLILFIPINNISAQTSDNPQLSFVVFSKDTFYGMNLDNSSGELRFRINQENKQRVLFIDVLSDDGYYTIAAINDKSIFITYQNIINTITPTFLAPQQFETLFGQLLYDKVRIPDPNQPSFDSNSLIIPGTNQLFASEFQKSFIIEATDQLPLIINKDKNWMILSPIPSSFNNTNANLDSSHPFLQRMRVEQEIRKYVSDFSVLDGFKVLQAAQPNQERTASIVFDPGTNQIYVVLDKNFDKIWMINLDGATIETYSGFDKYHKGNIPELGITTNDLRILNFSNESLMDGVIIGGCIIVALILIVIGSNYLKSRLEKTEN